MNRAALPGKGVPAWKRPLRGLIALSLMLFFMTAFLPGCTSKVEDKAFFRAERALGDGDYLEAVAFYRIFVEDFAGSERAPEAQYQVGVVYQRHIKNGAKAMEAYSMLLYLFPGAPQAMLAREERAKLYSSWGRHRDSIAEYAWMLEYGHKEKAGKNKYSIALEYIKMGDYGQARIELDELVKSLTAGASSQGSGNLLADAYYQIATTLQFAGDYSAAVVAYDRFIEKFPVHPLKEDAWLQKATVLEQSGKLKEAVALLIDLRVLYPELAGALDIKIASAKKRLSDGPKLNKKKKRRRRRKK
jgi:TolA-binding protein